ncbi:ribosome-inactivating family protein [Streptomyces sp. NPDC005648]|uniref:ribosome-inactivating family protein n=1 Tax=Streptomyces sp. NPDC005648 TaxID=3157044 RepID=UPI00339F88DB
MLSSTLRTTVAAAVASAVLIGGASLAEHQPRTPVTIGTQNVNSTHVSNDTRGPISLTLTDSGPNSQRAYNNVIDRIRQRVADSGTYTGADGRTYSRSTLTNGVVAERPSNSSDYFAVHLQDRPGTPQLDLVMNASNLYVVGFYDHDSHVYYRMGAGPENPIGPEARPNDSWIRSGHYTDLSRLANQGQRGPAFSRPDQTISLRDIRGSIEALRDDSSDVATDARAITRLITAFAEAARFDYISYRIQQAIGGSYSWNLGTVGTSFTNNWAALSNYLRDRLRDHAANVPFHVAQGFILYTVADVARQLGVAYMDVNYRYGGSQ